MHQLEDALGKGQIAQAHRPEVAQRDAAGQALTDHGGHRLREQHLPAVRGAHDTRGAVDRRTVEVLVPALVGARVQSAANVEGDAAVLLHRRTRDGVVARQGRPHPLRILFPHPGAAFDVSEQIGPDFGLLVQAKPPLTYSTSNERRWSVLMLRAGQASSLGLRRIELLDGLSPERLDALARPCAWRNYETGQRIISRNAVERDIFFLASGRG